MMLRARERGWGTSARYARPAEREAPAYLQYLVCGCRRLVSALGDTRGLSSKHQGYDSISARRSCTMLLQLSSRSYLRSLLLVGDVGIVARADPTNTPVGNSNLMAFNITSGVRELG